jgi:hypothetical protein
MPSAFRRRGATVLLTSMLAALLACSPPRDHEKTVEVSLVPLETIPSGTLTLPNRPGTVKFAVMGDTGRGNRAQRQVADQMTRYRKAFRFPFVLMLGDNIYEGPATADDYRRKFEEPYQALLDDRVRFYAVLGNHDDPRQVHYRPFHMNGERYYSFSPPEDLLTKIATRVEFFALDTTNLDRAQLRWLDERLEQSDADWKICFFHHPLYTSGRYRRTSLGHRWVLEPVLVRRRVDAAFSGHEHIYQRSSIQQGVQYFVSGGGGSLRRGDGVLQRSIERTFSQDLHFMLVEIDDDHLYFQTVSRTGVTVDAGTLTRGTARRDETTAVGTGGPHVPRPPLP